VAGGPQVVQCGAFTVPVAGLPEDINLAPRAVAANHMRRRLTTFPAANHI